MAVDVEALISDARIYAAEVLAAGTSSLDGALADLRGLVGITVGGTRLPEINITPPAPGDPGEPPLYVGDTFHAPAAPGAAPTLLTVNIEDFGTAPTNIPSILPFNPPVKPTGNDPNAQLLSGVPDVVGSIDVPAAPDLLAQINGITPPPILALTIPDAPQYIAPAFEGVRPIFDATPPGDLDVTYRSTFDTISPAMRGAIETQLDAFMDKNFPNFRPGLQAIENRLAIYLAGGTALPPAIEDAIYNRARDKQNTESARARAKNWGEAARAGHSLPSPVLINLQAETDQAGRDNLARVTAEIAIDQAKREQENLQFAVKQSTELRKIAIDAALAYYGHLVQLNGQALEYTRSLVDTIVKVFDLKARYAEIQARIYETDAQVFEARIRGAMAVIEAYRALIQGEEAKANVNRAQVEVYRARIEAVQAEASVYRTLVESLGLQVQLKRLQVDVYDARVRAYGSQVNAYTARWQGYEAGVRGEAAKVQASAEGVRAFGIQVQAYGETVRAKATKMESVARVNESLIRSFHEQVEAYRALVSGQSEAIRAEVDSFDATIKGFMAKANAISEKSRSEIASYEAGLRAIIATAQIFMEQLRESDNMRIHRADGIARVGLGIAEVYSRVAGATVSGMNSLVSSSQTESA